MQQFILAKPWAKRFTLMCCIRQFAGETARCHCYAGLQVFHRLLLLTMRLIEDKQVTYLVWRNPSIESTLSLQHSSPLWFMIYSCWLCTWLKETLQFGIWTVLKTLQKISMGCFSNVSCCWQELWQMNTQAKRLIWTSYTRLSSLKF